MDYASLKAMGKSFDTFCPLGPVVVTLDELTDRNDLTLECRLNGEIFQRASSAQLLFGVEELIEVLSGFLTLQPGDVILTGTPTPLSGTLPKLVPGDILETTIDGIGALVNRCRVDSE
jgi:2-keto-4-pentenoate hydratase/2-oxohepta-3-ene-1,7-dioic acid hydratase in catechol pathway